MGLTLKSIFNLFIINIFCLSVLSGNEDFFVCETTKTESQSEKCRDEKSGKEAESIKVENDTQKCGDEKPSKESDTQQNDKADKEEEKPPPIGNLSLPASQQPSVLFGFGGNIIDPGEVQLFFFADGYFGGKRVESNLFGSILFGVTDKFSVLFIFPYIPYKKEDKDISCGISDCSVQLEYAFYNKSTYSYVDQATLVGNISVPTGSVKKSPPTGFGSVGFFLGATYFRSTVDWFVFAAPGAVLTTSENRTKIGDMFLYQFGFGKNIPSPPGWIYAWIFEVDGQYNKKDRIRGKIDENSGGNSIFVTPSIWISSREMLFQFGVSLPVNQNYFGKQGKFDWGFNLNFAWSFY